MNTQVLKVDPDTPDPYLISEAGNTIRSGGLVAFPTETVYGLGANALNPEAIERIFHAKGRPQDNPLILHLSDASEIYPYVAEVSELALKLMARFWPGPLTLVLPRTELVPSILSAGLDTVAIRVPDHPVAQALIRAAGVPVAAPSANSSGKPSPTQAAHVIRDLSGKIDMVIDGGETNIGLESTVLDLTGMLPTLLRPGGVTLEQLREVLGEVMEHQVVRNQTSDVVEALAPGMKYRHYAPKAGLILLEGSREAVREKMTGLVAEFQNEGKHVGVITMDQEPVVGAEVQKVAGKSRPEMAHNLFRILREFDEENIDVIIAEGVPGTGLGLAIMNRLKKASFKIYKI